MGIKLENITYIYGKNTPYEKTALKNVNIDINDGEFIGLIGHTGSGKSTLIQHFNGLIKPTSGKVLIDNIDINDTATLKKDIRMKVGLVFQYPEHQLFESSVFKDVAFGPQNMGIPESDIPNVVKNALKLVGIKEETFEKSPFELSGGQKRRVCIAGVLAMKPKILILDEPTAGLDPAGRDDILNQLKILHNTLNITIVLVSHCMEDVANYVDRIIVMDKGQKVLSGNKYDVFKEIDFLESIGLGVPKVTKLCHILSKNGFEFQNTITTLDEAKVAILNNLKTN